jgi:hypothetical protein
MFLRARKVTMAILQATILWHCQHTDSKYVDVLLPADPLCKIPWNRRIEILEGESEVDGHVCQEDECVTEACEAWHLSK